MDAAEQKMQWAGWVRDVLGESVAQAGLKCLVSLTPAQYRDDPVEFGKKIQVSPEKVVLSFIRPLEWKVDVEVDTDSDSPLDSVVGTASQVIEFTRMVTDPGASPESLLDLFGKIGGGFVPVGDEGYRILYKHLTTVLEKRYSQRNIRLIEQFDDYFLVHARVGQYYIRIGDYARELERTLMAMDAYMRRPLRYAFLDMMRRDKNK